MIPIVIVLAVFQLVTGVAVLMLLGAIPSHQEMEKRVTQLEDAVTKPTPPPPRRAGFQ